MKAIVLAAGKGTRLLPLTGEIPKPMAPVAGKPMIQYIFELLAGSGVHEVNVNVFHLAESILGYYGERSLVNGMSVNISREEQLMGTAGGVKRLAKCFDGTFVVVMGDALTDVDLQNVVAFHKKREALATLALMPVSDTSQYGVVELDTDDNILSFQEKPAPEEAISTLANTGIYVLEPEVLEYVPDGAFFDFANDLFPRLLAAGERFVGYRGDFYWSDVGNLEAYRAAQSDVLSGKVRVKIPGQRLGKNLWIDRGARLHPTVNLEGPVVLGQEAVIGREATLCGDVTIGPGCWVHPGATVKSSILLPGSQIGREAYLEGCIVGPDYEVRSRECIRGGALSRSAC
jgi:mannose-1-phosphate guanylyltransferase